MISQESPVEILQNVREDLWPVLLKQPDNYIRLAKRLAGSMAGSIPADPFYAQYVQSPLVATEFAGLRSRAHQAVAKAEPSSIPSLDALQALIFIHSLAEREGLKNIAALVEKAIPLQVAALGKQCADYLDMAHPNPEGGNRQAGSAMAKNLCTDILNHVRGKLSLPPKTIELEGR